RAADASLRGSTVPPLSGAAATGEPPPSWLAPLFSTGEFFCASIEGSAPSATAAFAGPSSRAPVAREPFAPASAAGAAVPAPGGPATDDSQTWVCPPVSPGAEAVSEFNSASPLLNASDDVSSIPGCALNGALRIFWGFFAAARLLHLRSARPSALVSPRKGPQTAS